MFHCQVGDNSASSLCEPIKQADDRRDGQPTDEEQAEGSALVLACLYERHALYGEALAQIEKLRALNPEHPQVETMFRKLLAQGKRILALSQPEGADVQALAADNGLLQAWEVFEQVRLEAELVVLSACETGLGQEVRGEGLLGLTRAFAYAGARSVLVSLWEINDASTSHFMAALKIAELNGQWEQLFAA